MDSRLVRIIWLLRIGAIGGFLGAALMGLMMATFATDAPGSSHFVALLIGIAFFAAFSIPAVGLPLWAVRRIEQRGVSGLLPAAIFAIISLIVFPLGTILGVIILFTISSAVRRP